MNASNTAGLDVPWVYIRHALAQRWACRPWEVDAAPWDEVEAAITLFNLEDAAQQARASKKK